MAKAARKTTTPRVLDANPATYASARFRGLDRTRFAFDVIADDTGRCIYGAAKMTRDEAFAAALDILVCAATILDDGLTEAERQKLRDLADAQPMFGARAAAAAT